MSDAKTTAPLTLLGSPLQRTLARIGIDTADFTHMAGALGTTPKRTIFTLGTLKLQHFTPTQSDVYRVPVLIVTSLVNQPYILDLVPGQSMVEFLLNQGFDVYMIEWGRPRREHQSLTLAHYVQTAIPACVRAVQDHAGERDVSVIGYCVGGLLAAMYASLRPNDGIKNLICMAAPVNSDGLHALKTWMGEDFNPDALLDQYGNIPGDWVQNALRALRPFGKLSGNVNLLNNIENEEMVRSNLRMGKWETDNVPFPGGVFREMVSDFLRGNKLVKGQWKIGGERVDLRNIKVPFAHLLAQDDHITPYESSKDLLQMVGSKDKSEIVIKGGHVGLVAGRGAEKRMWPALNEWLAQRSV
jgi:polyhydroxyalkanoate synthase subunit PhaC